MTTPVYDIGSSKSLYHAPEPGQVVEVRRRHWVVGGVKGSSLDNGKGDSQTLVSLSSLDEDSLGEELEVVWQIEPGARILEKTGLPELTGWDSADRMEAFLDAVRWGAVTNADRSFLQAPFRSGISIEDYQLDPLVRAVDMARANLLIADDVGLGKTIEAGLVVQELLVRHRARTVFIVCPASLQLKWKDEMREKFGLEFKIVDTEYLRRLRRERGLHVNPWTSFPRLIASIDWMKTGEGFRLLKDALPPHKSYPRKFDILLIDEAHVVAPSTLANYSVESQRTKLVRTIAPHFEHKLFLSATPHNGYQESFTSLLEILDDQRFARNVPPDEKQLQSVMVRRLKTALVDSEGNRIYPVRELRMLDVEYTDEELRIHDLLNRYTKSRSATVSGSRFAFGSEFVHILLKKRLFSSPMAFATTLAKHRESLTTPRQRKKDAADRKERILYNAILKARDEISDEETEERTEEAMEAVAYTAPPLTDEEARILDELSAWAESAKNKVDSKGEAILEWLEEHLMSEGSWNDKRVILFTEYRATLSWLEQILVSHGYGGGRLAIMHGSVDTDERERIKAAFQADSSVSTVRILLATDAASEGIDLQNHCNYLVHVEIPWNPNVMEQRNGRIDRHGQKASRVFVWHPVGKRRDEDPSDRGQSAPVGDQDYLRRAVEKVESIREDLGTVGPVIARQIEEAMLGKRTDMRTEEAERKARSAKRYLTTERKLEEKIERLHKRLVEAREDFRLSPDRVESAVSTALELAHKPPLEETTLPGVSSGKVYDMPALSGSWAKAADGLEHPHTRRIRPITFDHEIAKGRDDVVLAHLNHELVQMCLRLLREEIWRPEELKRLHRVAIKSSSDDEILNPVVVVWARLVITGGDHGRLHEEITFAGGEARSKAFTRIPQIGRLDDVLAKGVPARPKDKAFKELEVRYRAHRDSIAAAVEARSRDRLKHLTNTLERRKESEMSNMSAVLDELENKLRSELNEERMPKQLLLPGLDKSEKDQMKKDIEAMKARLAKIPEERRKERGEIARRYENPTVHTFPIAVEFVLPGAWTEEER